jgi:cobalamin biosynthesis protein CobD/CbiB
MRDRSETPAQSEQPNGSYVGVLVVNSFSIGGAFFLCGLIVLLARLSGQPDAANHPIVFAGIAVLTLVLFLARSRTGEFYRLMAVGSMGPLAGMLGHTIWGLAVGLLMVGMVIYFLFRPRTVWRAP